MPFISQLLPLAIFVVLKTGPTRSDGQTCIDAPESARTSTKLPVLRLKTQRSVCVIPDVK